MKIKEWEHIKRKPEDIRTPRITSNIYLQFSAISEDIQKFTHLSKGKLLDIGAGMSPYKPFFEKYVDEYIRFDSFDYDGKIPNIIGEGTKIPLSDSSIDTVLCTQVLEHVPYPQKIVDEIHRILKKDGVCIMTTHMASPLHGMPHDYFRFTKQGLKFVLFKEFKKVKVKENGGAILSIGQFIVWGIYDILPEFASKLIIIPLNLLFKKMDKLFFNNIFTTNYIVIARK